MGVGWERNKCYKKALDSKVTTNVHAKMLREHPLPVPLAWEKSVLHEATFQTSEVQMASLLKSLQSSTVLTVRWTLRLLRSCTLCFDILSCQMMNNYTDVSETRFFTFNWQLFGCSHCLGMPGTKAGGCLLVGLQKSKHWDMWWWWKGNLGKELKCICFVVII